jgi:hypothetical protein
MAWTGFFGTLAPGASTTWWYSWGGDRGAQLALANPLNPGGRLLSYDLSKKMENGGSITYFVSVRNTGSVTTNYNLQGGGLT